MPSEILSPADQQRAHRSSMWGLRLNSLPCKHHMGVLPRAAVRLFATSSTQDAGEEQVAFISGASGGLGLEFARQLLQRPGQR